jgi:hypothetical protein
MSKIVKYSKEQILQSKHFTQIEKDILNAILANDKTYGIKEAKGMIKKFKGSKVK